MKAGKATKKLLITIPVEIFERLDKESDALFLAPTQYVTLMLIDKFSSSNISIKMRDVPKSE